jgi:hypothetical protein
MYARCARNTRGRHSAREFRNTIRCINPSDRQLLAPRLAYVLFFFFPSFFPTVSAFGIRPASLSPVSRDDDYTWNTCNVLVVGLRRAQASAAIEE